MVGDGMSGCVYVFLPVGVGWYLGCHRQETNGFFTTTIK